MSKNEKKANGDDNELHLVDDAAEERTDDSEAGDEAEALTPEEEVARERDDYKDRWMRAVAEQDNLRKRTRREVVEARLFATADVVRGLLDVVDDFERALAADPDENDGVAFREGVELIRNRLLENLERRDVKRIPAEKGDEFDPHLHEAVAQVPGGDAESGSILEVAQAGYQLGDMVLRPARVIVAQ